MILFIYYSLAPVQALFNFTIGSFDGKILFSERLLDEEKKQIGKEALEAALKESSKVIMYEEESMNLMCDFLGLSIDIPTVFLSEKVPEVIENKSTDQRVYNLEECLRYMGFPAVLDKRYPANYIKGLIFFYKKCYKDTLYVYERKLPLTVLDSYSTTFKYALKDLLNKLFQTDTVKYPIKVQDISKDRILDLSVAPMKSYEITNNYKARQYYKRRLEDLINEKQHSIYVGEMTYSEYPSEYIDDILKENLMSDLNCLKDMEPVLVIVRFDIKKETRYLPHIYYILLKT